MGRSVSISQHPALLGLAIFLTACATNGVNRTSQRIETDRQPGLEGGETAALARADSLWNAGNYATSRPLYQAVLHRNPSSSRAVFRTATLLAWDSHFDEAIALFTRYIALEPRDAEGRLALARAYAWSGRYPRAIAIYDSVLAGTPGHRDAFLGRAQTLAWAGRTSESLAAYKDWQATHPRDHEAALGYARTLLWSGQLADARATYTRLVGTGDVNAEKGLARLVAYEGDLAESERTWRDVLTRRPDDVEALTGLAEVLRGQGRQNEAEDVLQRALNSDPTYGDARALLRWIRADLRPNVTLNAIGENDSEHNRAAVLRVDYTARAPWKGTFGARYLDRSANFAAVDSRASAGDVFARWQPGRWDVRADGGLTHHSSNFAQSGVARPNLWNAALNAGGMISRTLSVAANVTRIPFDETALLIASGVVSTEFGGEVGLLLPGRLSWSAGASRAAFTGGSADNTRLAYSSTLRWTYNPRLSFALGGRQYGYDTTSIDGYFAPKRYSLAEASARTSLGGQLGWNADAEAGLGQQQIVLFGSAAQSRLAERAALSAGYRFDPSHEFSLSGGYANVAQPGQTTGSEYKAYNFALRVRVGF